VICAVWYVTLQYQLGQWVTIEPVYEEKGEDGGWLKAQGTCGVREKVPLLSHTTKVRANCPTRLNTEAVQVLGLQRLPKNLCMHAVCACTCKLANGDK